MSCHWEWCVPMPETRELWVLGSVVGSVKEPGERRRESGSYHHEKGSAKAEKTEE